jgi:hypothetical protein
MSACVCVCDLRFRRVQLASTAWQRFNWYFFCPNVWCSGVCAVLRFRRYAMSWRVSTATALQQWYSPSICCGAVRVRVRLAVQAMQLVALDCSAGFEWYNINCVSCWCSACVRVQLAVQANVNCCGRLSSQQRRKRYHLSCQLLVLCVSVCACATFGSGDAAGGPAEHSGASCGIPVALCPPVNLQ